MNFLRRVWAAYVRLIVIIVSFLRRVDAAYNRLLRRYALWCVDHGILGEMLLQATLGVILLIFFLAEAYAFLQIGFSRVVSVSLASVLLLALMAYAEIKIARQRKKKRS
jgi:hypothetical protein